jgi:hypothetical protein
VHSNTPLPKLALAALALRLTRGEKYTRTLGDRFTNLPLAYVLRGSRLYGYGIFYRDRPRWPRSGWLSGRRM